MMNIWLSENCCVTEYNEAEWEFIDALPKEAQRKINMGLATPYDYGYKAD